MVEISPFFDGNRAWWVQLGGALMCSNQPNIDEKNARRGQPGAYNLGRPKMHPQFSQFSPLRPDVFLLITGLFFYTLPSGCEFLKKAWVPWVQLALFGAGKHDQIDYFVDLDPRIPSFESELLFRCPAVQRGRSLKKEGNKLWQLLHFQHKILITTGWVNFETKREMVANATNQPNDAEKSKKNWDRFLQLPNVPTKTNFPTSGRICDQQGQND